MVSKSEKDIMEKLFNEKIRELLEKKRQDNNFALTREEYDTLIAKIKDIKMKSRKAPLDYRRLARYDVLVISGQEKLIKPIKGQDTTVRYYVTLDEVFDILYNIHSITGHGGRCKMLQEICKNYCNITKEMVMVFLSFCQNCLKKRIPQPKTFISKPIISNDYLDSRGQVDLIDMQFQICRGYAFVMMYQDHLTKFVILRALKTNTAEEVAQALLSVFTILGAPVILESENGREFSSNVVRELCLMWKDIKVVHGRPRISELQSSGERASHGVGEKLALWMHDNNTLDWVSGLHFVQFMKNNAYNAEIKRAPFEAMFGARTRLGLASLSLPKGFSAKLESEEDLEKAISSGSMDVNKDKEEEAEIREENEAESYRQKSIKEELILPDNEENSPTCEDSFSGAHSSIQSVKMEDAVCGQSIDIKKSRKLSGEKLEIQAKVQKTSGETNTSAVTDNNDAILGL